MIAPATAPMLSFHVGEPRAALPLAVIRGVLERPAIAPVPGSHPHVAGVTLTRGVAVPVYDLTKFAPLWARPERVAVGAGADGWPHLIICEFGEVLVGLLAERADLLGTIAEEPGPPPDAHGGIRGEYLGGLLRSGSEVIALLDPERLFPSLGVPTEGIHSAGEGDREDDPAGR